MRGRTWCIFRDGWDQAGWQDSVGSAWGLGHRCLSLGSTLAANRSYYPNPRTTVGSPGWGLRKPGLSPSSGRSRVLPARQGCSEDSVKYCTGSLWARSQLHPDGLCISGVILCVYCLKPHLGPPAHSRWSIHICCANYGMSEWPEVQNGTGALM